MICIRIVSPAVIECLGITDIVSSVQVIGSLSLLIPFYCTHHLYKGPDEKRPFSERRKVFREVAIWRNGLP